MSKKEIISIKTAAKMKKDVLYEYFSIGKRL